MDLHLARIDGQPRSSWIVDPADGRLPFTDAGKKARAAAAKAPEDFDNPEARDTQERCLTAIGSPEGPPMMNTGFNANYQIVQTRDYVAIQVEMNHDVRIIRMGDRSHHARRRPALAGRLRRLVGGRHPGGRDHQPQPEGPRLLAGRRLPLLAADARSPSASRARPRTRSSTSSRSRTRPIFTQAWRARDADAHRQGADLRIRLPRGQLLAAQHPGRRAGGGAGGGGRESDRPAVAAK